MSAMAKKQFCMTQALMHSARIVLHPSISFQHCAQGVRMQGPLGTVHVQTALYDPTCVMALKLSSDVHASSVVFVHAPSPHVVKGFCTLIKNMMQGLTQGFLMRLTALGVGYKMHVEDNVLHFRIGLSHPVKCLLPPDVKVFLPKPTQLLVFGIDKQRVTQVVAQLRSIKPPEPYKGKGLRVLHEHVRRKEGKKK